MSVVVEEKKGEPFAAEREKGFRYIGENVLRPDGPDKAEGRYDYLADRRYDGALYGAVLGSPHAHAIVKSIDTSEALKLPGVKVLTFEDAPDAFYNSGEWFPGQKDHPDERVLTGHVRHVGDRVALILAPDERTARAARDRVTVLLAVPTMYVALLQYPGKESFDVSSLRLCGSGGAGGARTFWQTGG